MNRPAGYVLALVMLPSFVVAGSHTGHWQFAVLLDGKSIGQHHYTLTRRDGMLEVQSEAEMRARFMFFDAYRYQHSATEYWADGCLQSIDAKTIDNNKPLQVTGERAGQAFRLATTQTTRTELPACVRSFAYWDPALIRTDRLLNAQTGELTSVDVQHTGEESVMAAGREWRADRLTLTGEKLHIDLWYGPQGEWLRLRSRLDSGRELDYRLESFSVGHPDRRDAP